MRKIIIPVFIPHKGCPHDCVFCNQKKISGTLRVPDDNEIRETIRQYIEGAVKDADIEIAFYGGSFTGIGYDEQERLLSVAYEFKSFISGVRVSTRPDCIDDKILDLLKKYNVRTIELGVQSLDAGVLKLSGRGHSPEDVFKASDLIKKWDITLGIQTMIGLPGDNTEKAIGTCDKVIALRPSIVRIYPTLVIKDTPLSQLYKKGQYHPLTLEEAVELTAVLLEKYRENSINVIRVGLQPTDSVRSEDAGGEVEAGPYHPAFRQLAESRVVLKKVVKNIEELGLKGRKEIKIAALNYDISDVKGQKKYNEIYLKNTYGFEKVTVISGKCADSQRCDFVL